MLSNGMPPSVGTKMIRLLELFMSCSTSIHCLVSASGDSVWFSNRCCSVCSRATSTRCRSVSICCSCAILLLIACTTCAGGWRSRRKNAVTEAIRNLPPPARGVVTRAESTSPSIVFAIWVRLEMSLMEYCTIPSRTPLRIALRTAPRIWLSSPISVKILGACIGSICQRIATSNCMPICSLAARGPMVFAGGVSLDRGPGRHVADAGEEGARVYIAERVAHPHFAGVDDDERRPGPHQEAEHADRVAGEAQQVGDRPGSLRAQRGRREEERKGDDKQDAAADELAHGVSGEGPEREDTAVY